MDHRLFLRYNKFADSYKMGQPNIYYFLKDCGFQRIYKANGNRLQSATDFSPNFANDTLFITMLTINHNSLSFNLSACLPLTTLSRRAISPQINVSERSA